MARPIPRIAALAALLAAGALGACAPDPGAEPVGVGSAASPMDIVSRNMPHSAPVSAGRVIVVGTSNDGRSQPVIIRDTDASGSFGGAARPIEARGGEQF